MSVFTEFLKNEKKNSFNIRRSKVTDYAALTSVVFFFFMQGFSLSDAVTVTAMLIGFNSGPQDGFRFLFSCSFSLCLCLTKLLQVLLTLPEAGALELTKYMRYYPPGIRLSSQYDVMANTTLSECCLQCFANVRCMAVNYRNDLQQCELSDQDLCQQSTATVDDSGWNIYMEYNRK